MHMEGILTSIMTYICRIVDIVKDVASSVQGFMEDGFFIDRK